MRFLHTSDLHLGRSLGQYSLLEAQRGFLERIVEVAIEREVDAVLVAGDVYDRAVPPAESVVMFGGFLSRLQSADIPVIVLSGNHDHPLRLGFGAELFRDGVHIRTDMARIAEPVELADDHGPVLVYCLPYLEPEVARRELAPAEGDLLASSHEAVVGEAMNLVRADVAGRPEGARVVVLSHSFVVGGEASDTERDIRVGGVPSVPSSVFEGAHYVALGHLHRRQSPPSIGTTATLHYPGSPLRYSISDAGHDKSLSLVELAPSGEVSLEFLEVAQPRRMADLRGTVDELTGPEHAVHREAWVRLIVTDRVRPDDAGRRLREAFPHYVEIGFDPAGAVAARAGVLVTSASDPLEVLDEFALSERGTELSPEEKALLEAVLVELREEARSR